jgi:hypothetical protein
MISWIRQPETSDLAGAFRLDFLCSLRRACCGRAGLVRTIMVIPRPAGQAYRLGKTPLHRRTGDSALVDGKRAFGIAFPARNSRQTELKRGVRSVRADVSDTDFALVNTNLITGESLSSRAVAFPCRHEYRGVA